jgi:pyruvate kinase
MAQSGRELLAALDDLRRSITVEAAGRTARWREQIELESFLPSAENLAHYLAFRHHDQRDLQRELMRHGLSSLGRLESRVMLAADGRERAHGDAVGHHGGSGLAAHRRAVLPR